MAMINIKIGDIQLQRKAKFRVYTGTKEVMCISAHHVAEVIRQHYGVTVLSPCDVYNACSSCPRRGKTRLSQRWPSDLSVTKLSDDTSFGVDAPLHANQFTDGDPAE